MIRPLNPKHLTPEDPSYKAVEELSEVIGEALDKGEIKNVALTGPFGSGKSSILLTLRKKFTQFEYLPISLATLKADEEDNSEKRSCEDIEKLNRRIEYSILQQIIYREKTSTVQNSRFKRIIHIDDKTLENISLHTILFFISFVIAFEPKWLRVESVYNAFNWGRYNIGFDCIAILYMIAILYVVVEYFVKSYGNSKLNKLNLKDGVIEIKEETSIFNNHLDEILYFFQVTKYNVVIIEDLDRFNSPDIFLKLRELNQLLNESKIIDRNIVFVYAVKDDIFLDEERTKFFDYITTVIPVINSSNSKDKLLEALTERGLEQDAIKDDDLREIAFFIQDMRILTNIANEFQQYREKLCTKKDEDLNLTKLLAMIVYKNYHPKEFAMLHRREGEVYNCMKEKANFVKGALNEIESKEKTLEEKYQKYLDTKHLKEADLRLIFLCNINNYVDKSIIYILIDGNDYKMEQISKNEKLFDKLVSEKRINYRYRNYYGNLETHSEEINWEAIDSSSNYTRRLKVVRQTEKEFEKQRAKLRREKLSVYRYKISKLISDYKQNVKELYTSLGLSPMVDFFIRRGFIDEDYYDYISFFYEGMLTSSDRELLSSIKIDKPKEFSYSIGKVKNFVKELFSYMFESKAILNNDLLDYVAKHHKEYFDQMMYLLETENAPLDFLAQYYLHGNSQEQVFKHYIKWDETHSWLNIESWANEVERNQLVEGWLKFCNSTSPEAQTWLNGHYDFLTNNIEGIGKQQCFNLAKYSEFKELNDRNTDLLQQVADNNSYEINSENLCIVANCVRNPCYHLISENNLNLSIIWDTENDIFIKYIEDNIEKAIPCFSDSCKDESKEAILFILNNEGVVEAEKIKYLIGQKNLLDDVSQIASDELITLAYRLFLINPIWDNVLSYYKKTKREENTLIKYIEHYADRLGDQTISSERQIAYDLATYLLITNSLHIKVFNSIVKSFANIQFTDNYKLSELDKERLLILLQHDMLPFCEQNTDIIKETGIYADYLIKYHEQFFEHVTSSYITSSEVAERLLTSSKFNYEQKKKLITIIPEDMLIATTELANQVLKIIINTDFKDYDEDLILRLLKKATNITDKTDMISLLILEYKYEDEKIVQLLSLLGGKFTEIAERSKHPVLEKTKGNIRLVKTLKKCGFISSVKDDKDGVRIYPRKTNN